ncbi:midasin-like isoform X1 [Portunus trituberculatus]|uniref:midasin-like isoform X1 n=1 Tax=Portunus trituberculatus TaxID=210409 RepID=UPI001E1CE126|nr:midasin-like isoform X1 [Portunus trituberculatus]
MAGGEMGLRSALLKLCHKDQACCSIFKEHLEKKKWNANDVEHLFRKLGQSLLDPHLTLLLGIHLRPWLLELLGRAQVAAKKTISSGSGSDLHLALCIALSKLVAFSGDAVRFCLKYFQNAAPPFQRERTEHDEPTPKKRRKKQNERVPVGEKECLQASVDLLLHVGRDLAQLWSCKDLILYLNHTCEEVKWLACHCIGTISRMSETQRESFILRHVTLETHRTLSVQNSRSAPHDLPDIWTTEFIEEDSPSLRQTVNVCGVMLPMYDRKSQREGCLITLPSTKRNLEAVGLAVCRGHPVLLEGVVGCGKTSIVEHLACVTGRVRAPALTKIQLGDQTDSKTMLGTYCCTQTPGEFIWRPGSLTQAVTNGYWLLLEDIDYAPMDVISILVPLLESRTLSLPGQGNIQAHPDFQLFASRRTVAGTKMVSGCASLLDKLWTKVTLETLTHSELLQLVAIKWPKLEAVSEKLVGVYLMLSSGQHEDDTEKENQTEVFDFTTVKTSGRLVSTRDLMKWSSRVACHIANTDTSVANRAFQEALDCFCAAVPDQLLSYKFALHIGSFMNRTKAEIEYYCVQYKPEVTHLPNSFVIGQRAKLNRKPVNAQYLKQNVDIPFSFTRPAACLLERICVAVMNQEPVLIVGETGTGKTSTVQYLAHQTRNKLHVINMNQQSDSTDLLGGFKPVEMKTIVAPVRQEFEELFAATFVTNDNSKFLRHIMTCFLSQRWSDLFTLMDHSQKKATERLEGKTDAESKALISKWKKQRSKIASMKEQVQNAQSALAFAFIEGTLIKAVQEGEWVLLDEINLASAETLECLSGLLECRTGSLTLLERGDNKPISRHPDFRLFACMNPATDVGKKELPAGLRNRFTEFFMEELNSKQDLMIIINDYLMKLGPTSQQIKGIKDFYKKVKKEAELSLMDGTGRKPHYSLRSLCRALAVAARNPCSSLPRSLLEAFCISFLTQLDRKSHQVVVNLIKQHVLGIDLQTRGRDKRNFKLSLDPIPAPASEKCVQIEGFWIPQGPLEPQAVDNYIITETVKRNLEDLVRVVSIGRFPVLLQGETSVGKTSLISYLAQLTGNFCVRINNHEHTDLQEYIGCYGPDESGKLIFSEGALVKAVRNGHWIILDELNLAPSDVLEALNRLLDDNRELFIPETQETVRAHPHFMLFATQNPPGLYGGRKVLSRAFRNRFVELHFTEIPADELEVILHRRCEIPLSYSKKMIAVLSDLQNMRRGSNLFQGKQSYVTLRDLFRWAERYRLSPQQTGKFYDWDQHIADEGYLVLAGRVRLEDEAAAIKNVLEKRLKRVVDQSKLFTLSEDTSSVTKSILEQMKEVEGFEHVVWTWDMRRLFVLVSKALYFKEPVLLVGETGCGKTTVCQMIAAQNKQDLHTVNCHMHSEGADFLGGLRPVRSHSDEDDRLFEWMDGPLIISMRDGSMFLADEISLADDSVLERLNSVLEPERMLVLAEKGADIEGSANSSPDIIFAHENFRFIGTMNPGGDYGKKELSPALRNRFTEIWCPKVEVNRISCDVLKIIEHNIRKDIVLNQEGKAELGKAMLQFLEHFTCTELGKKCILSIRDILFWVSFINKVTLQPTSLDPGLAYIHGACLVLLDGLGSGLTGSGVAGWKQLRKASLDYLCQQVWQNSGTMPNKATLLEEFVCELNFVNTDTLFGIGSFIITKGSEEEPKSEIFTFKAPRTCINLLRLLRGLQLSRPLLLEGSPGVGKTSLVIALAKASSHKIVRINLSEQTDVSDLFGADLPVEGGKGGKFAWRDGPLLQALRQGSWVVLDELNLASQSVLEGLNACFDHRGEIFVPELGKTFHVEHQTTKIFACQNPQHQGGARKGLPKSFLNRFTQVHVEALSPADLEFILSMMYGKLPQDIVTKMVQFNKVITSEIQMQGLWGQLGGPWDLNLRDMFRWCEIILKNQSPNCYNPGEYVSLIYADRMRTKEDKKSVLHLYDRIFGEGYPSYQSFGRYNITAGEIQIGHAVINRNFDGDRSEEDNTGDLYLMKNQLPVMESLIHCINMNWMALLVGESAAGKTCLVKLLARLTGKRLLTLTVNSDMDVTELLGGFQQVDYKQLLGEAVGTALSEIQASVRAALLHGEESQAVTVLAAWEELLAAQKDKTIRTIYEEMTHFHYQCDLLLAVLHNITDTQVSTKGRKKRKKECVDHNVSKGKGLSRVAALTDNVKQLQAKVREAGTLSGGGTFHWVDSLLVKAIRDGDWILIDGVNICSASVLDRLNGLLEPGGELSLNEQGVVGGSVPTVDPHPQFRLFLAMNPLHGEISRAMRNRGLEICILESWTAAEDLRALMLHAGLTSVPLQNVLFQAHHTVSEHLPGYEKPSITQMKLAASVTHQLIQAGYHSDLAVKKALTLVYVRSHGKSTIRKAANEAISEVLEHWSQDLGICWPHYENQVLSVQKLSLGSGLAQVKVFASLLQAVTSATSDPQLVSTWSSASLPLPCPLPCSEVSMLSCVVLLFSAMSVQDWSLFSEWVAQQLKSASHTKSYLEQNVSNLLNFVLSRKVCLASQALTTNETPQHVYDPRFALLKHSRAGNQQNTPDFESLCNKSSLWLWYTVYHCFKQNAVFEKANGSYKLDSMTLLEVSRAVNKGLVGRSSSPHASVPHLMPFFSQIDKLILSLTDDKNIPITNEEFCLFLSALRWCDHLYQFCSQNVNKSKFHLFLPQLTLHWHWVYEEFLQKIPSSWEYLVSEQFRKVVKTLHSEFELEYGPIHKVASRLRSCTSPAPFPTAMISDAQFRLLDLTSSLAPDPDNENVNMFLASSTGKEACELLLNIASDIASCNAEKINEIHDQISSVEDIVKEKCIGQKDSSKLKDKDLMALQVQTWPLRDYLASHVLSAERVNGEVSPLIHDVVIEAPGVYTELIGFLSGPTFRPSAAMATHSYLVLTQSTASRQTSTYLSYSPVSSEENEETKKSVLLHPAACQLSYILLAGKSTSSHDIESAMQKVPTGIHVEKLAQLRGLKSTLWNNWSILADLSLSYEASFTNYVVFYVTSSLKVLASALGISSEFDGESDHLQVAFTLASSIIEANVSWLPGNSLKQLQKLVRFITSLKECSDNWKDKANLAAQVAVALGTLHTSVLNHMEPVDPAQFHSLKLQYHQEELQDLESHLMLTAWFEHLRGSLDCSRMLETHPHLSSFKARCSQIKSEMTQISQQTAHRSGAVEYHQLKQDCAHFCSSVFIPEKIQELSESLQIEEDSLPSESSLVKTECLLASCDNFVRKVVQQYPLYRDITYPFLQAVTVTCEALRVLVCHSHIHSFNVKCGINLTDNLAKYSSFPAQREPSHPLHMVSNQINVAKSIPVLLSEEQFHGQMKMATSVALRAALLDLLNVTLAQHHLDESCIELISQLLGQAVSQWRQQEEEKARRAEEEESLYSHKSRTLAVSETEEEMLEREFQETFPCFDHEFDDLKGINLEDTVVKNGEREEHQDTLVMCMSDEQLFEISELHNQIFTTLVHTSWLVPDTKVSIHSQVVTAALLRFSVLQSLIRNVGTIAGCCLDQAMLGAHILSNDYSCSYLSQESIAPLLEHPYDIYKDPNPQEVLKVRPLLNSVRERVDELLMQWPGHPSLVMVNTVISRVLDFPLTSPLVKHIIGLETVLEKAQEWERNAHSGVSMKEQLEAVTHQVLEWRQLELNAWRSCLDSVTHKVAVQGRKWWPYLFDTFQAALTGTVSLPEVLKTLKQFLETAVLGDFQIRLQLLFSFHCHLAVLEKNKITQSLVAITWNLYHYFSQFLHLVTTTITKARLPIEKEVKGYVKIARWNDINYFAVRESVEKSRRTLHRHMRNWEKNLRQPFAPLMCDTNSELNEDHVGAWDQKSEVCLPKVPHPVLPPSPVMVKHSEDVGGYEVLSRLTFLTKRCHKLTCRMLSEFSYTVYVDEVEDTANKIISNYQELQAAATRAESAPSDKIRVKQLRGVMQRRRESLSRLFKILDSMGVTYTRGNTLWDHQDIDSCLTLSPVDLEVAHSDVPSLLPAREAWPGCIKYLNRSIGRLSLLLSSLQQPHQDLGPELIKRLRGISCHLFLLVRDQRMSLSYVSEFTHKLHNLLKDIREVDSHQSVSKMLKGVQHLHSLTTSLSLTLEETVKVLGTYTNAKPLLILEASPCKMKVHEAKIILEGTKGKIDCLVLKLSSLLRHFQTGHRLVTPGHSKVYSDVINDLSQEAKELNEVIKMLSVSHDKLHPVTDQLNKWLSEWWAAQSNLSLANVAQPQDDVHAVGFGLLENCLTQVLLSVENLYKKHCPVQTKAESEESGKDMLSFGLVKQLKSDADDLHMEEIVIRIQKLVKLSEYYPDIQKVLKASLPLLEQYHAICESVLLMMTSSNRSIAKLTSIIIAVFQNLAVKGFCRPQELQDEEGGEGATNFEDSGGTGLGEGEGKKDVSDRIESEDQLESALKEGEKEEAGDKDLQEEDKGIEMNEDFEGKMQDVEKNEEEESDSDNENNEKDFDKQMGETEKGADKLDEKIWGDDEGSEDEEETKDQDEEDGPGEGEATESKMVAKDDNKSKKERDKDQKKKEELEEMEDTRKENEMNEDGQEYDDNFTDPYGGEANMEEEEEEKMELPDDMNLDNGDTNENDDDDEMDQHPGEIEEKGVFPEDEKEPKEDGKEEDAEEHPAKGQEEPGEKESIEDDEKQGEKDNGEQDEEESSEDGNMDQRRQGTEEGNDLDEENNSQDKAEASEDKSSKDPAEAAEMDTTDGSKDQTKEQPKSDTGGQREEDEEKQEEQGQMGEQTEDQEGTGQSESRTREDAHQGESSALVTQASASDQSDMKKPRKPGETDENRTLGDNNKRIQQGLMTKESKQTKAEADQQQQKKDNDAEEKSQHSTYEHISKSEDHFDAHMVDAGTQQQAKEVPAPADRQEEEMADEDMLDTPMEVDEEELEAGEEKKATSQEGKDEEKKEQSQGKQDPQAEGEAQIVTEGETVLENVIQRPPETYFHTLMPDQDEEKDEPVATFDEDIEKTRLQIEIVSTHNECEGLSWARQEAQVASVAMQLCEQLRLILEPTQAARLRGDYRTGKRLNMRKVIPYIASQFRKDKIWLRRTQPSKRTYQILLAVDDSESMMEARAGSLAVESVALVTRALTLLEVGQLGVISFGATTKILHPLDQPFNETSGNRILTNLKFDQKVTNFSRMLEDSVAILNGSHITGSHGHPDTAQLLLILSDGQTQTRMETVKAAVRAARAARIFIVFLVLDAKDNKYSFYDTLVYERGEMKSIVESFPFPFFLVVRDIDTLPDALATALRQWFELVTADAAH